MPTVKDGSGINDIDLDSFLGGVPDPDTSSGESEPVPPRQQQNLTMPESDRIVVVGIVLDDSGSMASGGIAKAAIEGIRAGVDAFRGARGSDFYLIVTGFRGDTSFEGLINEITKETFSNYRTDGSTPLVATAISLFERMQKVANGYAGMGISASTAMLLITDGLPECDSKLPSDFQQYIEQIGYVVGMGCARVINSDEVDENGVSQYRRCFGAMGINKIVTPKADPADIRHEINQFSRSVAAIASSV